MILWRNIEKKNTTLFYHFDSDPRFPPFLLYVTWKSGVTFVWRCFRDAVIFTAETKYNFQMKNCSYFCVYTLSRNKNPCNPQFYQIKVRLKGDSMIHGFVKVITNSIDSRL